MSAFYMADDFFVAKTITVSINVYSVIPERHVVGKKRQNKKYVDEV